MNWHRRRRSNCSGKAWDRWNWAKCPPGWERSFRSVSTKETLRKLGITKLNELASTTPVQLQWQGLGPMELRQVSAVLEEVFLSLDRSDLLRVYRLEEHTS